MVKKVNSVTGLLSVDELGVTSIHEHIIVNPNTDEKKYDIYRLTDPIKAILDLNELSSFGCKTIVDLTPINYGRDPIKLREISKETNINIIMTTGYHKEEFLPKYIENTSVEDLADVIVKEIEEGIDGSGIKPNIIKAGSSLNTITELEKKTFIAACIAHKKTGIPISTHTDKGTAIFEQVDLFKKQGVPLNKVIIGHVDMCLDSKTVIKLLKTGVYVQFDHIGRSEELDDFTLDMIEYAIESNSLERVLISQDMGKKSYLKSYSGEPGLSYILKVFKDKFLSRFSQEDLDTILIKNVKDYFS